MKEIQLTQGKVALVDDEDYEKLSKHRWCLSNGYAYRAMKKSDEGYKKDRLLLMHREIMSAPKGLVVDHANHNILDNRKDNLRICTCKQNLWNRVGKKNGTSKYKGVTWHKASNGWCVVFDKKWFGSYKKEEDAALEYNKLASEKYGEYALLNDL